MIAVAVAVLRRPSLWPTAFRVVRRTAAPGWWRRPPFVPLPPADYLGFRMVTQYGTTDGSPEPSDVLNYLAWCREWDRGGRPVSLHRDPT